MYKSSWGHLVPTNSFQSATLVEHFFNCACSLMAIQIREVVQNSLSDFVRFFQLYEVRNTAIQVYCLDQMFYIIALGRKRLRL